MFNLFLQVAFNGQAFEEACLMRVATCSTVKLGDRKMAKFLERKVDFAAGLTRFTFVDGSEQVYELSYLSDKMVAQLALWGINEKVGNGSANFAKDRDVRGASRKCRAIWEALKQDQWEIKLSTEERAAIAAEAKAKAEQEYRDLVNEACRRLYGNKAGNDSVANYARKNGKGMQEAAKFLGSIGNVAKAMLEIQAERQTVAGAPEDADDIFEGLEDEAES
jgi:hypothetical protein